MEDEAPKEGERKMTNIEKLKEISTPAEEDWLKIAEEWEQEDNAEEFRKEFPKHLLSKDSFEKMKKMNRIEASKFIRKCNGIFSEKTSVWYYDEYKNNEY